MKINFTLILLCAVHILGLAQLTLEKDINDEGDSSFPYDLTQIGDYIYLTATDVEHGEELWRVNINTDEYELIADLIEGEGSASPLYLENIDNKLYFIARNTRFDYVLMRYDPETEIVEPIQPEGFSQMLVQNRFVRVDDKIVFQTEVSRNVEELGVYDMTTNLFEVILIGSTPDTQPASFTVDGPRVWCIATVDGERAFVTYNSENNAVTIEDVDHPTGALLSAIDPILYDGRIYYAGFIQGEGSELYALDIPSMSVIAYDPLFNGPGSGNPQEFIVYNEKIYFRARKGGLGNDLFELDPETDQIRIIAGVNPSGLGSPNAFQVYNDLLYFSNPFNEDNNRLFTYNGDNDEVSNILIQEMPGVRNQFSLGLIVNDQAYVNLYTTEIGQELYRYDLTRSELSFVADFNPTTIGSEPRSFTIADGKLYFVAHPPLSRRSLYSYNPNDGSIININNGVGSENADNLVELGDRLYYSGATESGVYGIQYYNTATGELGSTPYQTPGSSGGLQDIVVYNGKLFFNGTNDTVGDELFFYDPVTDQVGVAADIDPAGDSNAEGHFVFNNELFFTAQTPEFGDELYKYNDFTKETVRLTDLVEGAASSNINNLIIYNNKLFFTPRGGETENQWYSYDPLTEEIFQESNTGITLNASWPAVYNDQLYFSGKFSNRISGELLAFDHLTGEVSLISDVNGTRSSSPRYLVTFNDKLYFQATTDDFGSEVWEHSGAFSASIVTDINPGTRDSEPQYFTVFNDKLYFNAEDGTRGEEIWSLASCLNVVVESTTPQIDDDPTGSIDIEITGGTEPYIYLWDNGAEVEDLSDLLAGDYELTVKDQSGCLATIIVTIVRETTTANDELNDNALITVYPNPVQDELNIKIEQNISDSVLRIMDVNGNNLYTTTALKNQTDKTLNVNSLKAGLYYLNIENNQGVHSIKFVKI